MMAHMTCQITIDDHMSIRMTHMTCVVLVDDNMVWPIWPVIIDHVTHLTCQIIPYVIYGDLYV